MTITDPRNGLSAADIAARHTLRSAAAMIDQRWPGRFGDIAQRLEDLTRLIDNTSLAICELPHLRIAEEEECDRQRRTGNREAP